jgi:hypothetical protein
LVRIQSRLPNTTAQFFELGCFVGVLDLSKTSAHRMLQRFFYFTAERCGASFLRVACSGLMRVLTQRHDSFNPSPFLTAKALVAYAGMKRGACQHLFASSLPR